MWSIDILHFYALFIGLAALFVLRSSKRALLNWVVRNVVISTSLDWFFHDLRVQTELEPGHYRVLVRPYSAVTGPFVLRTSFVSL